MSDIHIHTHVDLGPLVAAFDTVLARLDVIDARIQQLHQTTEEAMADLTRITTEVEENGSVIDSAVVLLGSLSQQIRDLSTDPAALEALADSLDANSTRLAEAVVANTPAAPTP